MLADVGWNLEILYGRAKLCRSGGR